MEDQKKWVVGNSDTANYVYNNASDDPNRNFTVADCDNVGISKEEARANARLIAAAPEILRELQESTKDLKRLVTEEVVVNDVLVLLLNTQIKLNEVAINKALNK